MSIETAKAISNLAPDCRLVAIREQDAEIERLRASRDDWMNACNQAQEHRDGANAQLTIFESENLQLRNELERLRGLIDAHNADCIARCEAMSKQAGHAGVCIHYTNRGRTCPNCPRDEMIDAARGKE